MLSQKRVHSIFFNYLLFIFLFPTFLFLMAYALNTFITSFALSFFFVLVFVTFLLLGSQLLFEKTMSPYIEELDQKGPQGLYDEVLKNKQSFPELTEEQAVQLVCQVVLQKRQTFFKSLLPYGPILLALWISFNWPQDRGLFYSLLSWVLFSACIWPFYLEREDIFEQLEQQLTPPQPSKKSS